MGCLVSRRAKYKGLSIFKVPSGDSEFETTWRNKLIAIVTRDRVIDAKLKEQINNKNIYICQQHYRIDQYLIHDTYKTLNPGEIPTLNLPLKSFPASQPVPRSSAENISIKRSNNIPCSTSTIVSPCYKSYDEFKKRIASLKLPSSWEIVHNNDNIVFKYNDDIHHVPKYEIYTNDTLAFKIRYFLWMLPSNHEIYTTYSHSFQNVTVSNLITILTSYDVCNGISDVTAAASYIEHSVPKYLSLSSSEALSSPLFQSKFYRHASCSIFLAVGNTNCTHCNKAGTKEMKRLKQKESNLLVPAKLHAPVKYTAPERIKLTLQNYRLENKSLKSEIQQMKLEIENKSLDIKNNSLHNDFVSIMSNADNSKIPPFMKFFWEEQQKYLSSSKTGVRYHPMIIRYCLGLAAKSPSFYDDIRYGENNNTGFLMLPSRRRLRAYKNYIRPTQGFNRDVVNELAKNVENFSEEEKYIILLLDEMKIQEDLVWDKHTSYLHQKHNHKSEDKTFLHYH